MAKVKEKSQFKNSNFLMGDLSYRSRFKRGDGKNVTEKDI